MAIHPNNMKIHFKKKEGLHIPKQGKLTQRKQISCAYPRFFIFQKVPSKRALNKERGIAYPQTR